MRWAAFEHPLIPPLRPPFAGMLTTNSSPATTGQAAPPLEPLTQQLLLPQPRHHSPSTRMHLRQSGMGEQLLDQRRDPPSVHAALPARLPCCLALVSRLHCVVSSSAASARATAVPTHTTCVSTRFQGVRRRCIARGHASGGERNWLASRASTVESTAPTASYHRSCGAAPPRLLTCTPSECLG